MARARALAPFMLVAFLTTPLLQAEAAFAAACTSIPSRVFAPRPIWHLDDDLHTVTSTSASDVWALGDEGTSSMLVGHWSGTGWTTSSPNIGGDQPGQIFAAEAFAPDDVWAVGSVDAAGGLPAVVRWDGTAWNRMYLTSTVTGDRTAELLGVSGSSADDVWIVGFGTPRDADQTPLIVHWSGGTFSGVPEPSHATNGRLVDVATLSPTAAWAVGSSPAGTLIERWNGTSWSVVPDPVVDASARLLGVTAISANNVWAVGTIGATPSKTLVEHWNGASWAVVQSPSPGTRANRLASIDGATASDVWAVGTKVGASGRRPLIEHWNGNTWSASPSPAMSADGAALEDVELLGDGTGWAVGTKTDPFLRVARTLTLHLEAGAWSVVTSADVDRLVNADLLGVDASGPDDVWAVGRAYPGNEPMVEHRADSGWSLSQTPDVHDRTFNDVAARSPSDVWVVGSQATRSGAVTHPLTEHWDGATWSAEPVPFPRGTDAVLEAVDGSSTTDVWAVGRWEIFGPTGSVGDSLLEHWDGTSWSRVRVGVAPTGTFFYDVVARSASNVWAVGVVGLDVYRPVLVEWNGSAWRRSSVPVPPEGDFADALASVPHGGMWMAGGSNIGPVVHRRTAAGWELVATPTLPDEGFLEGISGSSASDVWSVGYRIGDARTASALAEHWDGTAWSVVPTPDIEATEDLTDVVSLPDGQTWIVGGGGSPRIFQACV